MRIHPNAGVRGVLLSTLLLLVSDAYSAEVSLFMQIPGIPGEAEFVDREEWIELKSFHYSVQRPTLRLRERPDTGPVIFEKFGDSASVYLNLATLMGTTFDGVVVDVITRVDVNFLALQYEFDGVRFVSYDTSVSIDPNAKGTESVGFFFDSVRVTYTRQNDDQSAGDQETIVFKR